MPAQLELTGIPRKRVRLKVLPPQLPRLMLDVMRMDTAQSQVYDLERDGPPARSGFYKVFWTISTGTYEGTAWWDAQQCVWLDHPSAPEVKVTESEKLSHWSGTNEAYGRLRRELLQVDL